MHQGKSHLNQKFPKFTDPSCSECGTRMKRVAIVKQEATGGSTTFTCRADCPKCGQCHLGHRVIATNGRHMKPVSQSFDAVPKLPTYLMPAVVMGIATIAGSCYWLFAG